MLLPESNRYYILGFFLLGRPNHTWPIEPPSRGINPPFKGPSKFQCLILSTLNSTIIFKIESCPPQMLNSKWSNKSPNFRWIMDSLSNVYRVYHPIRSDQTKSSILGGWWIVPPIYIEFISLIGKVKYLLVHYKEELKILQQISLQVGCLVSTKVNKEDE